MLSQKLKTEDTSLIWGVALVVLSAILFFCPIMMDMNDDTSGGYFIINYGICVCYTLGVWFTGRFRKIQSGLQHTFLVLVLALISAYSFNRLMPVFESSTTWLGWLLSLSGLAYVMAVFLEYFPMWLKHVIIFVIGLSVALYIYLAIYLFPVYIIGVVAFLALGLSLHTFVPLLLLIFTTKWLNRILPAYKKLQWTFSAGLATAVLVTIIFTVKWHQLNVIANRQYQHTLIDEDVSLMPWIKVAQRLPDNFLTEKYLKAGLVYTTPSETSDFFDWNMPSQNFDEAKKHDPLVMMAILFSERSPLQEEERVKILESRYDARHKTQERLWRGDHLQTTNVISNIKIWPQYRIAYTEKTVTVANRSPQNWRQDEEAIYTFHLPEGGVVTSLSLWINGIEEKAILTTKGKADTAYKTIVGVEIRDPSVVHWQEGNTVSVRVFPVQAMSSRNFKIGITAPLKLDGKELRYENIYFDGPDANSTKEIVQINCPQKPMDNSLKQFSAKGADKYIAERSYQPDWHFSFADKGLQNSNVFVFNANQYSVSAYKPQRIATTIDSIYLDINKAWTIHDVDAVMQSAHGKALFVFDHERIVRLTNENKADLFYLLQNDNFSLFPFYRITNPNTALVITKSAGGTPNIHDLKETSFARQMNKWLLQQHRIKLYNLGEELSPYLKTLKEHRVFTYEHGNMDLLLSILSKNVFNGLTENENSVLIDDAGIVIERKPTNASTGNAPDHLMRLFAYNDLMRQMKGGIFSAAEVDSQLVTQAQEAYIVTPLSSLIVLESAKDYERFNIKDSENSLHNASLKSNGAVPEPHEWALIILTAIALIWVRFKNNIRQLWSGI